MPPGDAPRHPGAVPDDAEPDAGADVRGGVDTDGDGHPDTLLAADGTDLLVRSDLDGDGLADRLLRIGPDAAVHLVDPDGTAVPGSAPATWAGLLDDLFDPGG